MDHFKKKKRNTDQIYMAFENVNELPLLENTNSAFEMSNKTSKKGFNRDYDSLNKEFQLEDSHSIENKNKTPNSYLNYFTKTNFDDFINKSKHPSDITKRNDNKETKLDTIVKYSLLVLLVLFSSIQLPLFRNSVSNFKNINNTIFDKKLPFEKPNENLYYIFVLEFCVFCWRYQMVTVIISLYIYIHSLLYKQESKDNPITEIELSSLDVNNKLHINTQASNNYTTNFTNESISHQNSYSDETNSINNIINYDTMKFSIYGISSCLLFYYSTNFLTVGLVIMYQSLTIFYTSIWKSSTQNNINEGGGENPNTTIISSNCISSLMKNHINLVLFILGTSSLFLYSNTYLDRKFLTYINNELKNTNDIITEEIRETNENNSRMYFLIGILLNIASSLINYFQQSNIANMMKKLSPMKMILCINLNSAIITSIILLCLLVFTTELSYFYVIGWIFSLEIMYMIFLLGLASSMYIFLNIYLIMEIDKISYLRIIKILEIICGEILAIVVFNLYPAITEYIYYIGFVQIILVYEFSNN